MNIKQGVYIGKNIEVAVTEKYTLIFVAREGTLLSFLAQSSDLQCIHVVKTIPEEKSLRVEYLLTRQGGMNYVKGEKLLRYRGQQAAELKWKDGLLQCTVNFLDEIFYAEAHELFTPESITPKRIPATADTLAECLNQWHLGVHEIEETRQNKTFFKGIVLNTPKHMYIYEAEAGGRIYTRAARYSCVQEGVAFNQNFRQFYEASFPEAAHCIIARDNRMALQELEVNRDFFQPNSCYLDKNTFYWSVDCYDASKIRLNGCGGKSYLLAQPVV